MDIELTKVRAKQSGLTLEYSRTFSDPDNPEDIYTVNTKEERKQTPHPDLLAALDQLKPHLLLLTEQIEVSTKIEKIMGADYLNDYEVRGYTLAGADDNAGFALVGLKHLTSGKVLNINSPFFKFADEYPYMIQLREAMEQCNNEIIQYIKGKREPSAQTEIEFK